MAHVGVEPCLGRLEELLRHRLGLKPDALGQDDLRAVLRRRARAADATEKSYLARLEEAGFLASELPHLAEALPGAETCFFRDPGEFHALFRALDLLPPGAPLRLLSAGCASGEEAYSLAIRVRELMGPMARGVEIRAVDLNRSALRKAAAGRYPARALRTTPIETRDRWFQQEGSEFVLDLRIRNVVRFQEVNLAEEGATLWAPASYGAVLCRKVLTAFATETARALVKRIHGALVPGGYLLLGHAETLCGLSEDFDSRNTFGAVVHRRKVTRMPVAPRPAELRETVDPTEDLEPVMHLLERERFDEALALIGQLAARHPQHSQTLLLQAVLLTQTGRFEEAASLCSNLLAAGGTRSAVRSLVARWRERRAESAGARDVHPGKLELAPAVTMPHLHRGLLAHRRKDSGRAVRELATALYLLDLGDRHRSSPFGGGLTPAALISLCRTELTSLGRGT